MASSALKWNSPQQNPTGTHAHMATTAAMQVGTSATSRSTASPCSTNAFSLWTGNGTVVVELLLIVRLFFGGRRFFFFIVSIVLEEPSSVPVLCDWKSV